MARAKKKTPAHPETGKPLIGRVGGLDIVPYYYTIQEFPSGWSAEIIRYNPAGSDVSVIRKNYIPTEAEAHKWARHHCNMRNYRPFEQETDFHPMSEPPPKPA